MNTTAAGGRPSGAPPSPASASCVVVLLGERLHLPAERVDAVDGQVVRPGRDQQHVARGHRVLGDEPEVGGAVDQRDVVVGDLLLGQALAQPPVRGQVVLRVDEQLRGQRGVQLGQVAVRGDDVQAAGGVAEVAGDPRRRGHQRGQRLGALAGQPVEPVLDGLVRRQVGLPLGLGEERDREARPASPGRSTAPSWPRAASPAPRFGGQRRLAHAALVVDDGDDLHHVLPGRHQDGSHLRRVSLRERSRGLRMPRTRLRRDTDRSVIAPVR